MIHVDPCEPPYCPICSIESCTERSMEFSNAPNWTVQEVISARELNDVTKSE